VVGLNLAAAVNSTSVILLCADRLQYAEYLIVAAFHFLSRLHFCFSSVRGDCKFFFKYLYCNIFYQKYFFHRMQSSTDKS